MVGGYRRGRLGVASRRWWRFGQRRRLGRWPAGARQLVGGGRSWVRGEGKGEVEGGGADDEGAGLRTAGGRSLLR